MIPSRLLLVACFAYSSISTLVAAGFTAKCTAGWTKVEKKIDPHDLSDLSGCQTEYLNGIANNDIKLGGKGDGSIYGYIPIGSNDDGCKDSSDCMQQCQALCCITKGCRYALIKREQDTDTSYYGILEEDITTWFCRMYSYGEAKKSDDHSYCDSIVSGTDLQPTTCDDIGCQAFGWTPTTMDDLRSLASVSLDKCPPPSTDPAPTCTSRRRGLLGQVDSAARAKKNSIPIQKVIPSSAQIKKAQEKGIREARDRVKVGLKRAGGKKELMAKMCKA